jgi:hypothetical protein
LKDRFSFPVKDDAPAGINHFSEDGLIGRKFFIFIRKDLQEHQSDNQYEKNDGKDQLYGKIPGLIEYSHLI